MSEIKSGAMVEKEIPSSTQDNAQEVATNSQVEQSEQPDTGSLIADSKKYRKRAQSAESELSKIKKKMEKQEEQKLAEQNEWKELFEKKESRLNEIEEDYNRMKKAENSYKQELLSDFDDGDREEFSGLSLKQIRVLHNKIINKNTNVMPTDNTPARSANPDNKKWTDLTTDERRSNWNSVLDSFRKN